MTTDNRFNPFIWLGLSILEPTRRSHTAFGREMLQHCWSGLWTVAAV